MQHDIFDPSTWLTRWQQAGGGWADRYLVRPSGADTALASLSAELDDDRRQAVLEHIANRATNHLRPF